MDNSRKSINLNSDEWHLKVPKRKSDGDRHEPRSPRSPSFRIARNYQRWKSTMSFHGARSYCRYFVLNSKKYGYTIIFYFSAIFSKGDNFSDFLFASLDIKTLSERSLASKKKICCFGGQIKKKKKKKNENGKVGAASNKKKFAPLAWKKK